MLGYPVFLPYQGCEQLRAEAAMLPADHRQRPISIQHSVDTRQGPIEVEDDLVVKRAGSIKDMAAAMEVSQNHARYSGLVRPAAHSFEPAVGNCFLRS